MAPSPLAMAPRDLPPLTAAPCNMVGEGVARGGSSCPRALQSHAQLRPRPPPLPPWGCSGGEGMGVAGVANLLSPERLLHRPFSYLPPAAGAAVGGEGICGTSPPPPPLLPFPAAGAAVGGRGSAAPAPPPPPPPPPSPPSPAAGRRVKISAGTIVGGAGAGGRKGGKGGEIQGGS
ncbi:unnamed protein product [Closterium sp. Naga37s-1]|nr:unnamed protein product [Closterium sp. Naga37s-1]